MEQQDYYAILGINSVAHVDEIKRAYHRLARQYHPDLHPGDPTAEAITKAINAAAEVLCDPVKRAEYDRLMAQRDASTGVIQGRSDGHDVEYTVTITRAEAQAGTERALQFHAPDGQPYTIAVPIPPGTAAGTRICMPGAGGPGLHGGRRGDMYVIVRVVGD